ncbi:GNAT family N-acetyltransferase, partial [Bacillus thuringiensis]|nr:GNAT family N-acetyltransferase [Bacillus thuringiensis]
MELNNVDGISIEKSTSINMEEMELLLLADPSTEVVNGYLKKGDCFVLKKGAVTV